MTERTSTIEARNLTRKFGAFTAVDAVTFDVFEGEIFGYLGANGAGKSTTIRMLCGLLLPTSGTARVAGVDVSRDPERVKRSIGYMSQKFSLYGDLTPKENLEFFGGAYGLGPRRLRERADRVLESVGLGVQRTTLTGELPGGWRQRLALACAMLHEPKILFLDEPTAGVDPVSRRTFWALIRKLAAEGTTILVTTHYMDEAEYCDRVGLMVDGRLAALDTPSGLKETFVRGALLEVRGADLAAQNRLAELHGVVQVERFGAGLHVRCDDARIEPLAVERALASAGFGGVTVDRIEPSLEDVFLEVTRRESVQGGDAGAGS